MERLRGLIFNQMHNVYEQLQSQKNESESLKNRNQIIQEDIWETEHNVLMEEEMN